jgi:hypothetical protein
MESIGMDQGTMEGALEGHARGIDGSGRLEGHGTGARRTATGNGGGGMHDDSMGNSGSGDRMSGDKMP